MPTSIWCLPFRKQEEGEDNSEYEDRVHREYDDISGISGIFKSFSDAPGGFKEELEEINYGVGAEYVYNDKFCAPCRLSSRESEQG